MAFFEFLCYTLYQESFQRISGGITQLSIPMILLTYILSFICFPFMIEGVKFPLTPSFLPYRKISGTSNLLYIKDLYIAEGDISG